jgi:hypothetical protein
MAEPSTKTKIKDFARNHFGIFNYTIIKLNGITEELSMVFQKLNAYEHRLRKFSDRNATLWHCSQSDYPSEREYIFAKAVRAQRREEALFMIIKQLDLTLIEILTLHEKLLHREKSLSDQTEQKYFNQAHTLFLNCVYKYLDLITLFSHIELPSTPFTVSFLEKINQLNAIIPNEEKISAELVR